MSERFFFVHLEVRWACDEKTPKGSIGMYAESCFWTRTCWWGYLLTILNSQMLWRWLLVPVSCVLASLPVNVVWGSLILNGGGSGGWLGAYCMYMVLVFAYAYAILVHLYAWTEHGCRCAGGSEWGVIVMDAVICGCLCNSGVRSWTSSRLPESAELVKSVKRQWCCHRFRLAKKMRDLGSSLPMRWSIFSTELTW